MKSIEGIKPATVSFLTFICFFPQITGRVVAQYHEDIKTGYWLEATVGSRTEGGDAYSMSAFYRIEHGIFTARISTNMDRALSKGFPWFIENELTVNDVALLLGPTIGSRLFQGSASIGLAITWKTSRQNDENSNWFNQSEWVTSRLYLGLPFQIRGMVKPHVLSEHLGVGITFYGNLNFNHSFAVGGLFVSLGSF